MTAPPPGTRAGHQRSLAVGLPVANFLSYFAIAVVEFAVPFVAVATLGANSLVVAVLGVCRFAPQVLLARVAARVVERHHQRAVMLASELLRGGAFVLSGLALFFEPRLGLIVFALANVALAAGSILTSVATQVIVPAAFDDATLPRIYARLGIAESTADAAAPFLAGLGLAGIGVAPTFALAAVLALAACALLLRVPRIYVPTASTGPSQRRPTRATLTQGLRINLATPAMRTVTIWAISYNLGQSIIEAVLLLALLQQTPLTAAAYGVVRTGTVLFAAVGAYAAERLPAPLHTGLGTAVFGFGSIGSYAVIGAGLVTGGTTGLVIVVFGFLLDEFCSGVVLVRIQSYRARAIDDYDRPIATASYRAVNLTAVPTGYAVGGLAGLVLAPAHIALAVGIALLLPALSMFSTPVRHET